MVASFSHIKPNLKKQISNTNIDQNVNRTLRTKFINLILILRNIKKETLSVTITVKTKIKIYPNSNFKKKPKNQENLKI